LESNNIGSLNEHFGKFGRIMQIQLNYDGAPDSALITFSTRAEAQMAFRSTDPILNNRFVMVYWYYPTSAVSDIPLAGEAKPLTKEDSGAKSGMSEAEYWVGF